MKVNELLLERAYLKKGYTIGRLYWNGSYLCDTLEPEWRDYEHGEEKVVGKSAMPEGTYGVFIRFSDKRNYNVLELRDVPMFRNIQIHPGNTKEDTQGCILVGRNTKVGWVTKSITTFARLMELARAGKREDIPLRITIKNVSKKPKPV